MSASEFEIIQRYFAESGLDFSRQGGELGIGDDAALLTLHQDSNLAISMDVLVENVHFPEGADPALIANRALAVNLSDLAAMAAQPLCFTLGLVLAERDEKWLEHFSKGLLALAKKFNCPLVGGDTTKCSPESANTSISIQVHGICSKNKASLRSGANPGDKIYVSGKLGDGAIALLSLDLQSHLPDSFQLQNSELPESCKQYFSDAYYRPQPRIALALAIRELITSSIDISDGLLGDLGHITSASNCGAKLILAELPVSESARCCVSEDNQVKAALFGGDDYELCFTVPPVHCAEVEKIASGLGEELSCIGEIVGGNQISCFDHSGSERVFENHSYQHF